MSRMIFQLYYVVLHYKERPKIYQNQIVVLDFNNDMWGWSGYTFSVPRS